MSERVRYAERGSSWWPLCWGPLFAALGALVEIGSPGSRHLGWWLLIGGIFTLATALWVYGRRRLCSVRLTTTTLRQGREELPVSRIDAVSEVGTPVGARVLGGSWTVPRGTTAVPLRLTSGEVVLAWAKAPEELSAQLARLVEDH